MWAAAIPVAVNNNASSVSFGALLAVPGLTGWRWRCLALLLAGIAFRAGVAIVGVAICVVSG